MMLDFKESFRPSISPCNRYRNLLLMFIAAVALLSYGRLYLLHDIVWDDNCWLLSAYASANLEEFLNTGFVELRRVPLGTFFYFLFSLHKNIEAPYVYWIWHSINIASQIVAPVFLFLFVKNLFKGRQILAFFIAVSFAAFPLDASQPYYSAVNYRIAMMLSVLSFYFTERACNREDLHLGCFSAAVVLSGIAGYVFIEVTVVFEAARFFVLSYIFSKAHSEPRSIIRKAFKYWLPFFFVFVPLMLYKLIYKPYGIYADVYKADFLFLTQWKSHIKIVKVLLFHQWRILLDYMRDISPWSVLLGVCAGIIVFIALKQLVQNSKAELEESAQDDSRSFMERLTAGFHSVRPVFYLGIAFLMPPLFLMEFARREISFGMNSSHFVPLQIGYAVTFGCLLYIACFHLFNKLRSRMAAHLFFVVMIGLGVFFSNVNLDLYFNGSERQKAFWQAFTKKFPTLPENAVFMMDVRDYYYYDASDLDNTYDLEPVLNILYTTSDAPEKFRKYKVFAYEEYQPSMKTYDCSKSHAQSIERLTHFGEEVLNPCEFIVIRYRDNELLVNQEILKKYPDVRYQNWADKALPQLPASSNNYPLRQKLKGFFAQ